MPERLPNRALTTRFEPDDAPDVVAVFRANRRFARSLPLTLTSVSSALLIESTLSVSAFACCDVQSMSTPRVENVHAREPRDRRPMAHRVDLHRLPLAVAE